MTLFRKLSVASVLLSIAGSFVGWGGEDGTAETTAEIAMLVRTFGIGGMARAGGDHGATGQHGGRPASTDAPADPADPTALLSTLLK